MGSERSQNAPGERGPDGEARHFHTPGPRLPRSQPGTSGRCQGLWHLRERWARGGVLSTRGRAMDGDACNLWLNWR